MAASCGQKLSALEAELARVTRSRDANQATNKLAAAQIDRLEIERLTHERELIEQRMRQLEIRAPIGGVIVERRFCGGTPARRSTLVMRCTKSLRWTG